MMIGDARRESSQVLCSTIVFLPPKNISEVYSSIALAQHVCMYVCMYCMYVCTHRLESPT